MNPISLETDLSAIPVINAHTAANNYYQSRQRKRKRWPIFVLIATVVLLLSGALALRVSRGSDQQSLANQTDSRAGFNTVSIPLDAFNTQGLESFETAKIVSVNGQLKVNGSLVLAPVNQPSNAVAGQLFYDKTTNQVNFFNGTNFVQVLDSQSDVLKSVGGLTGAIGIGAGISSADGQLTNSGVLSLQGQTGNISFTGGTGILVNGTTLINTGVTSVGNQTGAISIGAGLTLDNRELKATGTQTVNAGTDIAVTTDGLGNVTISYTGGSVQPNLPVNSVVIGQGTNPYIGVSAISPGMCLVSTNGAPVFAPCPGSVATGNVSTAGGTPGRIAKFSGTLELDDSLLSETGTTVNVAGDINLSTGFRFLIDGTQISTTNLADQSDICLISAANCAPATGSFIQNGTVQQASANFNISGNGTAATLNAATALQLGGVNINVAGTLTNVAYLNQANNFTGGLTASGSVRFSTLSTGIVQSSSTGVISSSVIDRNSPTLLTGTLTVANGGTGLNMITANGLVYGNGTNTAGVTAAGTAGQIVVANASSVPTFVSVSGDIAISASGVTTIGSGVVTNAKLANSSLTVTAGTNLTGGGLVSLGDTITLNVASAPTFSGTVNSQSGFQLNGSDIVTSLGVLQNVTANANIITSGTLPVARGGTGVAALPANGQLLIGNGTGYVLAGLTAGTGVVITNAAGAITVSVDNTVCTTGGNCSGGPSAGSNFYIQNGSTLQTTANFNIDGTGIANIINAVAALQLNGVSINTAGTLSNVAYLNQSNAFGGNVSVTGTSGFSVGTGAVTLGSLGSGLVQANASGVLTSSALSRNSALLTDTLSVGNGGTGLATTPNNGQLLIGNGSGYTLANLAGANGVTITNAAGAITVGLNNTVCTSSNPCESPPAGGSTNYIQNGTVQQASADFNISGGGTASSFNALTGLFINGININTAGTLSNIAYLNQANAFAGNLSVTGTNSFSVGMGTVTFAGLSTGIVQSNSTGVVSSGVIDRNSATYFTGNLNVNRGGTGQTSFTANGLLYGNGTAALGITTAGTGGQLLLANASGVPTFTSVSGDIAISATGVTTIASGSVTNAKLANSSLTVTAGTNLTGGGLISLGGTVTLNVASAPTFTGNVDAASFSRGGTTVITSSSVLQNVTANANIITGGTLPIARGGTGVTTLPGNGQLLIGNGTGYDVAALTAGTGVTITNAAGAITVSIDNSVCTTSNNCPNPAPGSSYYIQNGTGQQTTANFNIDGSGTANIFNAVTAYRLNGVNINTAGTLNNVAYLNQANTFSGNLSVTGTATLTTGTGAVTFGSLGAGLVQANASGVLSSGSVSRNSSALFSDTLSIGNGGTGITATPTNGQLLIGNGTGYTLATISAGDGVSITNAAGAITVAVNASVCSSSNPCTSPPAGGSTNYIQNGTVQQASADFNISGGGTANTFNALSALQINGSNINTAGTLSNVAYLNQANTFSGTLTISTGNLTVTSGSVTFGDLGAGIVQANASGVLSSGAVDRNSATLFSNSLSVANGGTGATGFTANGVLIGNGSGAISTTSAGTSGQLLLTNGSGVPTFTSVSGDIAISATGVTTIQNSSVTNAKLANSSITIDSTSNLVGGGTVALGGTLSLSVASSPSFAGTINAVGGYQLNGTDIVTSTGALQNVTTSASIVTSGTFGINRGGTGLNSVPANGQLLIGNGTGYTLSGLLQGSGITVTTGAGSITVAVDNTICTTANNCGYQTGGGGSGDYIQNSTSQQANSNFNISGTGRADILNAVTGFQVGGAAAAGQFLRGNGTNFVSSALQASDIVAGSNNYIQNTTTQQTSNFNIISSAAGNIAARIQAASGQTADIFAVYNEFNAKQVFISSSGFAELNSGATVRNLFNVFGTNTTQITSTIQGAASQTADLLQLKSNGSTVVAKFDIAGNLTAASGTFSGQLTANGSLKLQNGSYTGTISQGTLTANRTYTLPDADGTICLSSGNCGSGGSYINNSSTQQTGANFNIDGTGTAGTLNATAALQTNGVTRINASGAVTASQVSVTNTNTSTVASSVRAIAGQTVDSFQVQDASGNKLTGIAADGSLSVGVAANVSITPTFTKLADPATMPTSSGYGTTWSPDGQYMSVAHGSSPYITIYKRNGNTFTKLADPAILPASGSFYSTGTAWSPDGQYMSVTSTVSPFITIYKRSGDTFTKLADPATLPTGLGQSVSWSSDGQYMSVAHATTPFITIYKRSGDTFTKLANPATLPANTARSVSWSSDGQYMSVAHATTPFITIYKRSGDTFTKLADPATLPTGTGLSVSWSSDGQYVSVAHSTSPFITIYKRSGDTFTKLANPASLPTNTGESVSWSPDGQYMSVGTDNSPYIITYKRSGDTFTRLSNPSVLPGAIGRSVSWSPDGQYMSVASNFSSFLTVYSVSTVSNTTNTPTLANLTVAGRACIGTDSCNDTLSVAGTVGVQGFLTTSNLNVTNYLQTGGYTRLDANGNLLNINDITASGNINQNNGFMNITNSGTIFRYSGTGGDPFYTLQIQASNGDTLFDFDTSGSVLSIGRTYVKPGLIRLAGGNFETEIGATSNTQRRYINFPDADGTVCLQNATTCGFAPTTGGAGYIQNGTTQQTANFNIRSTSTTAIAARIQGASGQTADLLRITDGSGFDQVFVNSNGYFNAYNGAYFQKTVVVDNAYAGTSDAFSIKADANQTANLISLQNSSGNFLSGFASDGSLKLGTAPTITITPSFAKLANPASLPASTGYNVSWSPDGTYMNVLQSSAPYLNIYKRSGNTFTKLSNPSTAPTSIALGSSWSPDNQYLSVAHNGSPFISIYKRSGDTFTKLGNPANLPASNGTGTSWSPDGQYLSVTNDAAPFITIYKRSGDTFTKLSDPAILPTGGANNVAWSPDGNYMSVAHSTAPFITIYKRSGDTFTKLSDPATLPTGTGYDTSFSPDGQYMTVTQTTGAPYIFIYKRSGDTFTKLANPATLPAGAATKTTWSPDSRTLAVSHDVSPYITIYNRNGDTFTKLANPATLPTGTAYGASYSPDGSFLSVAHDTSPYVTIYSTSLTSASTGAGPVANLSVAGQACIGSATCNDTLGVAGSVGVQGFLTATNINVGSYLQTGGINRLDANGNLTNINSASINGTLTVVGSDVASSSARILGVMGQAEILSVIEGNFGRTLFSVNQNSQSVIIDSSGINYGGIDYALRFGSAGSGEGIGSKRNAGNGQAGLNFYTGSNVRMTILQNGNICIGNQTCSANLGVTGTIRASSSITANTTPDIAEMIAAAPDVEAADVVMADPSNTERVVKASGTYNSAAVGVISDGTSSFMINSYGGIDGGKPLVLAGRVPVKVTNENGAVKPGDHLTVSSTTGHAMKATRAGATIGTALGFFNGTTGTVLVLVNPSYYDPFDGNNLQASTATISTLNATNATITNLTVGSLVVNGDITVNGHFVTAGNTPTVAMNALLCADTTITIDGNDTAGQVIITTGLDCGTGTISGNLGTITFAKPYNKAPRVVMTPANGKAAAMAQTFVDGDTITAQGFNIDTLNNLAPGTTYRWYYHTFE